MSMPPGNMLLVVISRSLCECHIKAKPASVLGEFAIVPEGGVLPVLPQFVAPGPALVPFAHPVARGGGGGEEQRTSELGGIALADDQVAVAAEDADVVAVLVEGMLPTALANDAQQYLFTWMHVRIAVVRLVRILGCIVRIHIVWHGAPVDHEIRRMVGFGWDGEAAAHGARCAVTRSQNLRLCLSMD